MTSTPFTPYWEQVGPSEGPFSWVFFAVARVAGRHRPLAVVSSIGDNLLTESLQGGPLVAACQRLVVISTRPANVPAVRAELALADDFYARGDGQAQQRLLVPAELPEFNRHGHQPERRPRRGWNSRSDVAVEPPPFPFIASCLLQGVGFDARAGITHAPRPELLGTVYRDTSAEWGMVVVDLTDPAAVRYGIVGFHVAKARFVDAPAAERYTMEAMGPGGAMRGELHVIDEVRPRQAMSAADYSERFEHEEAPADPDTLEELSRVLLIDADAMVLVWPPTPAADDSSVLSSLASLSIGSHESLDDQALDEPLVQSTLGQHDFDVSSFDEARAAPGFQERLQRTLIQHTAQLGSTPSAGKLIRIAFAHGDHLSLERLSALSVHAVSAALAVADMGPRIASISIRVDRITETTAQLATALAACDTLCALYLLVSPTGRTTLRARKSSKS